MECMDIFKKFPIYLLLFSLVLIAGLITLVSLWTRDFEATVYDTYPGRSTTTRRYPRTSPRLGREPSTDLTEEAYTGSSESGPAPGPEVSNDKNIVLRKRSVVNLLKVKTKNLLSTYEHVEKEVESETSAEIGVASTDSEQDRTYLSSGEPSTSAFDFTSWISVLEEQKDRRIERTVLEEQKEEEDKTENLRSSTEDVEVESETSADIGFANTDSEQDRTYLSSGEPSTSAFEFTSGISVLEEHAGGKAISVGYIDEEVVEIDNADEPGEKKVSRVVDQTNSSSGKPHTLSNEAEILENLRAELRLMKETLMGIEDLEDRLNSIESRLPVLRETSSRKAELNVTFNTSTLTSKLPLGYNDSILTLPAWKVNNTTATLKMVSASE